MARVRAILRALATAVRRDAKSYGSFSGNNLFLVSVVLLFFSDPGAFVGINFIIALILFLPLSSDPLRKIPPERLAIWPLRLRERRLLRFLSPWLNPMTLLLAALVLWKGISAGLWALVTGVFAAGFVASAVQPAEHSRVRLRLPDFPGPLNELIRKSLRQILTTLDFYCGLLLSAGALLFRVTGTLPDEARLPMTLLVMLAVSTYTHCLLGLDGEGGLTRNRLLPLSGWQALAACDVAFGLVALLLTLPLSPLAGFTATLVALAIGHQASVTVPRQQTRWRFSTGASFAAGIFQVVAMIVAAAGVTFHPVLILPCIAAYAWSTWWYGRELDRRRSSE